ncbi:hypothetical protein [Pseudomonas sp. 18175]|uniref:hypothetical protein n=1 Tax=Pseudomonas sp. 18175 TaxID=3390056 RepID=UPI003D190519
MKKYIINGLLVCAAVAPFSLANAACSFESKKGVDNFTYAVSDEDCKLIKFDGESVVTIRLKYPSMKLVGYKDRAADVVTLKVSPINAPPFDIDRAYLEAVVVSSLDGVDLLEGKNSVYRVLGRDGTNAYISDGQAIYIGRRAYENKLLAHYTFSHEISDIKKIDEFVSDFLDRFLVD